MVTQKIENVDTTRPIVMVDDNEIDLEIGRRLYAFANLENPFMALNSGHALLDHLEKVERDEEPCPAVVLLDVNMPQLNGFDTLKRVRQNEAFREVPVVVMFTNSDNPLDMERAAAMGANGYRLKQFEVDSFVTFLHSFFE
ncbi:response regulator [Pelagicoccus sp. SDUM812002]|uniref:response regulator n=1 Tax=Pelagicoccus sp. SDUM812002 TaxID=3041266 RepID=UPI0028102D6E|nr:response regulator [Pelagicoccus sp. SDUM812002]MDQ8184805.1 response regulator [Pelagicoccus sp. SDUM812002]